MALAELNASQVLILQTLLKHPRGLSTKDLAKRSGAAVNSGNIGPVFRAALQNYPESLYARKYVLPEKSDEEDGTIIWKITPSGREMSHRFKLMPSRSGIQVPAKELDAVAKAFMTTRTYGLDVYTDDDLAEIRAALDEQYHDIPLDDLKQLIVNRRKQGAFADPYEKRRKCIEKAIREFGPRGTIASILTEQQVTAMLNLTDAE